MIQDKPHQTTILVVDDTPTNLNILFNLLKTFGYRLLVAPDGEKALKMTPQVKPDIILLDIMMPGIDGFEVCQRLKENPETHDIPVLFMTARTETTDKIRGFQVGGVDYITKPFQHEEVLARLRTHLTIQEQREALKRQKEELTYLNQSKDRFFSIIAHDLRGPLTGIKGLSRDLLDCFRDMDAEELQEALHQLWQGAENVFDLMEKLLEWARVQQGQLTFSPHPVPVADVARYNISIFADIARQKKIRLESQVPPEMVVTTDPLMFDTLVRNLVSNAVKFTRPGGLVRILAGEENDRVTITVEDNGVGMSNTIQQKLFRIDQKVKTKGTANEPGAGIGLILCAELCSWMKGRIEVASEPGNGSQFTITLPKIIE